MSDSSSKQLPLVESFDSNLYIRNICDNTKVTIRSCVNAQFPKGWKGIVDVLITSLKNYPISITRIHDTYSILDISFDIDIYTKEIYVWRAVDKARLDSAKTCGECGIEKGFRRQKNPLEILCDDCIKAAGDKGTTHTWLDKY